MRLFLRAFLVIAVVVPAVLPARAQSTTTTETEAEVPALTAFHEVIYPLWHTAWPAKDVALMRELLPKVKTNVAALQKASLPGILRDKKDRWNESVANVVAATDAYDKALAKNNVPALLAAVERLHAEFEGLIRLTRPAMPELEAYHQVLYRIYHHDWPDRNLDALRADSDALVTSCNTLMHATLPTRYASRQGEIFPGIARMCIATTALRSSLQGGQAEAAGHAVERVHASYQDLEKLFE
jgi:hypothetical protein